MVPKVLIASVLALLSLSCGVSANRQVLQNSRPAPGAAATVPPPRTPPPAAAALAADPLDPAPEGNATIAAAVAASPSTHITTLNDGHWTKCEADGITVAAGGLYFLFCACQDPWSVISVACYADDNTDIVMAATGFGLPDDGNVGSAYCDFKNLAAVDITANFDAFVYCAK